MNKYEEALERAKSLYGNLPIDSEKSKLITTIFPELDESEDKRIRKEMVDWLKSFIGESTPVGYTEHEIRQRIAWLEKQKEQKSEDEECTDFTIYHPLKNGNGEYKCIPYSFYGSLTSFSEDKDLIDFLRTCFYTIEECNEWIERQKEQKPAEWSEEDKKDITHILKVLDDCYIYGKHDLSKTDYDNLTNTLKSLRPRLTKDEDSNDND